MEKLPSVCDVASLADFAAQINADPAALVSAIPLG